MNNDDEAVNSAYKKLEREKVLLNAANAMRLQTNNETVKSRLDAQMREGRRNIQYLEDTLRQLQMRRMNQGMDNMNLGPGDSGSSRRPYSGGFRNDRDGPPTPPPKDSRGYIEQGSDRGGYGTQEYSQIGGHGDLMPPRHPYGPPGPGSPGMPKQKSHYSKLGVYCCEVRHLAHC
jgi:classical protein kinase C